MSSFISNGHVLRYLVPVLALGVLMAGCLAGQGWPSTLDATRRPPGISRSVNGTLHVLWGPIFGPIAPQYAAYSGPKDWQGNPAIGDAYIDSLNFKALAACETGGPAGNPKGYNPDDDDSGGARYGAYQAAKQTWHYAVDLNNNELQDPYQDPRNAPLWYQTYREKRLMLKELVRGPATAWRYPGETHHRSCGERLFVGRPRGAPARIG